MASENQFSLFRVDFGAADFRTLFPSQQFL